MKQIKGSILGRLLFSSLLMLALIAAIAFFLLDSETKLVPFEFFILSLFLFLLFFAAFTIFDVIRPLKIVLKEMQTLLTGNSYKKIFSTRIDEIGILAHFFNEVTKTFSRVSYDIKEKDRVFSDLEVASSLQRDILPLHSPDIAGLQVVAKTKPATEIGGDAFNFFESKGKVYIYIGDVTGHGVAAGLIMTMVNSLISVFSDIYDSPYEILVQVNKYIKRHVKRSMFMTMVMLCWEIDTKKLSYVGAGHEHILIYRTETGECQEIMSGGIALGMVPDNSKVISEKELDLNDGDFVVLYSDGIIEARDSSGALFGLEQLKKLIQEYAPKYSADGVNYHIAKDVSAFMGSTPQGDDITLIVLKKDSSFVKSEDQESTNWESN